MTRQALTPSSALPLVYFGAAHAGLMLAFGMTAADPEIATGHFLHPRMVAVVHLVTVAWISGSILGAFYIVAPLALGMPLPVGRGDWLVCIGFLAGTIGIVAHFWSGRYDLVPWLGGLVLMAVLWLATRATLGVRRATAPWPVLLHVVLAFSNMMAAALLGMAIGFDRAYGVFGLPPLAAAFAHVHLAVIGWPMMMVVGLAYRLVPMFLPARMPAGNGLAASALLLELGIGVIVVTLLVGSAWLPIGAALIAGGLASFVRNMRAAVKHRLPRPPALPTRDWSTWQTHVAIAWLFVAAALGLVLTTPSSSPRTGMMWVYGVAGLVGFLSQIVVGIQGRLVPMYAYYRAMSALDGAPPPRGANQLPTASFARPIFLLWTVGVPWFAWGVAAHHATSVRLASLVMLAGVVTSATYLAYLMRTARQAVAATRRRP